MLLPLTRPAGALVIVPFAAYYLIQHRRITSRAVFVLSPLVGVGVYFTRRQKGLRSYLLADQDIHWIIVAVSVLAALFSGRGRWRQ